MEKNIDPRKQASQHRGQKFNYAILFFLRKKSIRGESERVNAIIFGAPGSGKGTYASRLQARLGIDVIAMGDIFREIMKEETEIGKKVKGYVENGLLVPDDIVNEVLKQRLAKVSSGKGFILDGYSSTGWQ